MNVYTFLDTNNDSLDIFTPYTGDTVISISGTGTTGINPDLLGDPFVNSPASMLTDPNDAIINILTANVASLSYIVDQTFNGIVYSYSKDEVFIPVNMGADEAVLPLTLPFKLS